MKKFLVLGCIFSTLLTGISSVIAEEKNYTVYNVGDSVTLVDGSKWHVISYSGSDSDELILFSDYFVMTDGTQYQDWNLGYLDSLFNIGDDNHGKFDENRIYSNNTFCSEPEDGSQYTHCNVYEKVDGVLTRGERTGTVGDDSYIKNWVDNKFLPNFLNNIKNNKGLVDNISARLITIEEISAIESLNLSSNSYIDLNYNAGDENGFFTAIANIKNDWLKAYNYNQTVPVSGYYTMSPVLVSCGDSNCPSSVQSEFVYAVAGDSIVASSYLNGVDIALNNALGASFGIRPVVTLNKANVADSKEFEELNKKETTTTTTPTTTVVSNQTTTVKNNISTKTTIENPKTADMSNQIYIIIGVIALFGITSLGVKLVKTNK